MLKVVDVLLPPRPHLPQHCFREMEGWELADECERIAHKAKLPIGDKYVLLESARKLRNL